jgi:YbbR domain-containing protein
MKLKILMWRKQVKGVRTTTARESQQNSLSDSDSDALARVACGEGENNQKFGGLNLDANGVIKGRASNLFNVTEEEVDNPQYWIDL